MGKKSTIYDSDSHNFRANMRGGVAGTWVNIPNKGHVFYDTKGQAWTVEDGQGNVGEKFHPVNLTNYDLSQIKKQFPYITGYTGRIGKTNAAARQAAARQAAGTGTGTGTAGAGTGTGTGTAGTGTGGGRGGAGTGTGGGRGGAGTGTGTGTGTAGTGTGGGRGGAGTPVTGTPTAHEAVYTANKDAKGAYSVGGWKTTEWGGGKKGVLDASIAQKLGLKEGATAEDAQNFLKSKGYGITSDNYWGKQSQAAFNDYINRGNVNVSTVNAPELQTQRTVEKKNYGSWNPTTRTYEATANNGITSGQLRRAGITSFQGYQSFMNNKDNATNGNSGLYNFLNDVRQQNPGVNFNNEDQFNQFYGSKGHFGRNDRNRIISTSIRSYEMQPTTVTERTDYGKQYDNLNNILTEDQRKKGKISWVNSGNSTIPVYQGEDGTYYKQGDDGKLTQTGTYSMGDDGKYSLTFRNGGRINKFQQGGSMDEQQQLQQAFLQYLAQQTGAKSQQELEQIIQQMGEDGLKQAYAQFVQAMQQQQIQAAKFGAKLNYIRKLNGKCPEGMQMYYYKQGGRLCKKCIEMQARGGEVDKPVGDAIQQFKAAVSRNKKKFGNKYDADQLAGRKPVGKDSQGRELYLDGDGNAKPVTKHSCGSRFKK